MECLSPPIVSSLCFLWSPLELNKDAEHDFNKGSRPLQKRIFLLHDVLTALDPTPLGIAQSCRNFSKGLLKKYRNICRNKI